MKKEGLTAKHVQHMKPDPKRRIEVPAGPPAGLYLVVHPTGAKSWALRYRYHGRPRKLTFDAAYPDMTLAAARAEALMRLETLEKDSDPALLKRQEAEAEAMHQESVANVVEEWLRREVRPDVNTGRIREKRWQETERIIKRETKPWRTRDIGDIAKPDVLRLLDAIVDRGASVMACRTRGKLLRFFKWAKGRGYIEASPMIDVGKPGPDHQDRDRALEPNELAEVWNATETLGYPSGPFVRFLILTAQRRGEVASMRWRDVDLDRAMWTLPKEATKAGRVHDVPLSTAAVELLRALPRFDQGDCIWTTQSGGKPINGFSKIKSRIDAETLKKRRDAGIKKNIADWTMHDLRRTAATRMAEQGVPPHVLAAILNHTPGSSQGITAIYNRFRYTEERRQALQAWAEFVADLEKPAAKRATA